MPDKKLVVIGDGPGSKEVKRMSTDNIVWLGHQDPETLRDYMQRARAYIFAAKEDFGIMPLEAQACGTPVIAFGQGGVKETIRGLVEPQPTGVFFTEQSAASICRGVNQFEENINKITTTACRKNAERFSIPRFRKELRELTQTAWHNFQKK